MPKRKKTKKSKFQSVEVPTLRMISFAVPWENVGWFQISDDDFKKRLIPFLVKASADPLSGENTDIPVVFKTQLGKMIVVQLGGITVVFSTFSQAAALREG